MLPSHCKLDEHPYINARMANVISRPNGYELVNNGKILSICTSRNPDPYKTIIYRYGRIGQVELEAISTKENPFKTFSIESDPVSNEIIFFQKGSYFYYVSEATNQGYGISLIVYKSDRKILKLFSGNEPGVDYESGATGMTTYDPSPQFLKKQKPKHVVW